MCVAVKRKLQLYYWKNNEFKSFGEDINLTDIPKALSWCKETICVGYKGEYSLYEVWFWFFDFKEFGKKYELCCSCIVIHYFIEVN